MAAKQRLRRGFKSEASGIASEVRTELGLQPQEPLDPWILALYLEIPVMSLHTFEKDVPFAVQQFSCVDTSGFSAMTVFRGVKRLIVYNDVHSRGRQASDISHELSHALLGHQPKAAFDSRGCRDWDPTVEDEAAWLGGVLLITDQAALNIVRHGWSLIEAANYYGVSQKMVQYRLNVSAAKRRISYLKAN